MYSNPFASFFNFLLPDVGNFLGDLKHYQHGHDYKRASIHSMVANNQLVANLGNGQAPCTINLN
jgi:hypothetical protein